MNSIYFITYDGKNKVLLILIFLLERFPYKHYIIIHVLFVI